MENSEFEKFKILVLKEISQVKPEITYFTNWATTKATIWLKMEMENPIDFSILSKILDDLDKSNLISFFRKEDVQWYVISKEGKEYLKQQETKNKSSHNRFYK